MEDRSASVVRWTPSTKGDQNRSSRGIKTIDFTDEACSKDLTGFSGIEKEGRWTEGPEANITFDLRDIPDPFLIFGFDLSAFVRDGVLPRQAVTVRVSDAVVAEWTFHDAAAGKRVIGIDRKDLSGESTIRMRFQLHNCGQPLALKVKDDARYLAIQLRRIVLIGAFDRNSSDLILQHYGRRVGAEARKSFDRRLSSGFWERYINGPHVLDIGFRGRSGGVPVVPIVEGAIGIDFDYPGYDGRVLPFADQTQDAVYSSHCLEHIPDYISVIQDWFRVTRIGGHIIAVVPSLHLYERRRRPPSRWNKDHRRFYSPASLLAEFECALEPNSYRVRFLEENDEHYEYDIELERHPAGCFEIVLVIERIKPPEWRIDG